jgi:hypothetical protein
MVGAMLGGAGQFRLDAAELTPANIAMTGPSIHAGCLLPRGTGSRAYAREVSACKQFWSQVAIRRHGRICRG